MKFSIITVCFNSAAVLNGAMRSLAEQTCRDLEWVVVDGGSTDGSVEIVKTFAAAPMTWISEPDDGIYDAMNKAVALARGEYLYFLNSDDRLAGPEVLSKVAELLDEGHRTDLLIGEVLFVGVGAPVRRSYSHLRPHNVLFDGLCHQAVFARRDLFERYGRFDTSYRLAADFDWLARVVRAGARVSYSNLLVAEFAADGTHSRASVTNCAERSRIRRAQTTPLELMLTYGLAWVRHKARRLVGLPARGRSPAQEWSRRSDAS